MWGGGGNGERGVGWNREGCGVEWREECRCGVEWREGYRCAVGWRGVRGGMERGVWGGMERGV